MSDKEGDDGSLKKRKRPLNDSTEAAEAPSKKIQKTLSNDTSELQIVYMCTRK